MRSVKLLFIVLIIIFSREISAQYQLQQAFPNLPNFSSPIDLQNAGDCTNRLFVVEQQGIIKVFENRSDVSTVKTFLNITDRVTSGSETGLLGLAFHPDYENNGYFYVNYTAPTPLRTVISRFQVSTTNPDSADKNTELILLTQSQPFSNHNGGQISFGPDGYLYFALGDGGSGGDPQNHSQRLVDLLGKISRIDVNNPQQPLNYGIPSDNPFVDSTGSVRKEIYAYGLRNPWRFSFDFVTGWLWNADVGQNAYEEVNVIEKGKNYGWRCYEGNHPYNLDGCNAPEYIFPIWEYPRSEGYSVTGGFVYRGPNQPGLVGKYIYADYGSDKIWAITYDGINPATNVLLTTATGSPTSFGVDAMNELYICTFGGGRIYKFISTAAITAPSALTALNTATATVELNWSDNSNNEDGFKIERSENNGGFLEIGSVAANINTFQDVVAQPADYKYRVRAYNSSDNSVYSNEACITVNVVPVELSLFTIEISKDESSVILNWETASEKNNHGFEVERNLNDNWATIGFVQGNGTTTEKSIYQYVDDFGNYGFKGILQYRLKQVDFDGTFSYSGTVAIDLDILKKDYRLRQNYPNPFNPTTNIRFNIPEESKVKIEIINSLGEVVAELVNEVRQSGFYDEIWNAENYSSGVYYVRMKAESQVSDKSYYQTIKMLYLK
ncbi:MAG TPA: PQQ-dependent sugar dehydrogenase [Ignavibacteriaceae bacterium]|nr:PQQ-dependent sugar dehydrogenase [Ignavibacteriaceae bacterium]